MNQTLAASDSNAVAEYTGVYFSHWEAGGLEIEVGRRFFGLLPRREYWALYPHDFDGGTMEVADIGAFRYRLRFLGQPGPKGRFGHMGMCDREVRVVKLLECTRLR